MKGFHLFFLVFFLNSLLSAAEEKKKIELSQEKEKETVGKVISLVEDSIQGGKSNQRSASNLTATPTGPVALGSVKIVHNSDGTLCGGVLLKPWIVLTTAKCLQKRPSAELVIRMNYRDTKGQYYSVQVGVKEYEVNPKYSGKDNYDMALMHIYGRYEWNVDEYFLPNHEYSPNELVKMNTLANIWLFDSDKEEYYLVQTDRKISPDDTRCGEVQNLKHWYCAVRDNGEYKLNKLDRGSGLFISKKNKSKRLLGIFSGRNYDKKLDGHMYESVFPSIDWIDEFMHQHSLPPFRPVP